MAPAAGDGGQVAAPGHLDQDRSWRQGAVRPARQGQASSAQGQAGQACGHRRGVPGQFGLIGRGPDLRRRLPQGLRAAGQRPGPAAPDELGELGRAGEAADERGRAAPVRAQDEYLTGVRVRRAGLGVQIVAVVPEHHQAELGDRGEHRGPGARHHLDQAPAHGQPAAIAFSRPEVRAQADVARWALRHIGQGRVDAAQVAGIRYHDDHAAARGRRCCGGDGDLSRPFRARQRRPGGPDRATLRQASQERRACRVASPGTHIRLYPPARLRAALKAALRLAGGVPFGGGVPGRDGQPEHVGQRAGVPVRHRPGQVEDLRREHGLRRGHPFQPGQLALVLACPGCVPAGSRRRAGRRTGPSPGSRARPPRPGWPGRGNRRAGRGGPGRCPRRPGRRAAARSPPDPSAP